MPDINPNFAAFQKEIETLLQELTNQLKRANLTKTQLAQIAAEIDFFQELKSLGFEELVNKYFNNYDLEIARIIQQAKDNGVNFANVNLQRLELIRELDKAYLLGSAEAWSNQLQSELVKSSIRGDSVVETIQNLQGIPLTDSQLTTVINTSYWDTKRLATTEVYKNEPEQRFRYVAGMDINSPTKSDICKWLLLNQKPEGYTMAEIQQGIVTPYGIVDEGGRIPNFNCADIWEPIDSLTETALRIQKEKRNAG